MSRGRRTYIISDRKKRALNTDATKVMFSKLKQYKDMRNKAKTLQGALAEEKVEGSAAWGKVKIEMDGNQSVTAVHIDEEMMGAGSRGKLESAVKDAFSDAIKKAQRKMVEKMKGMGGMENFTGLK